MADSIQLRKTVKRRLGQLLVGSPLLSLPSPCFLSPCLPHFSPRIQLRSLGSAVSFPSGIQRGAPGPGRKHSLTHFRLPKRISLTAYGNSSGLYVNILHPLKDKDDCTSTTCRHIIHTSLSKSSKPVGHSCISSSTDGMFLTASSHDTSLNKSLAACTGGFDHVRPHRGPTIR